MSNNVKSSDVTEDHIRVPMTLTLRDVVFIIAATISMVAAWGMFGTRLSVVEEKVISMGDNLAQVRVLVKEFRLESDTKDDAIRNKLDSLEGRLRTFETNQAQLKILLINKNK